MAPNKKPSVELDVLYRELIGRSPDIMKAEGLLNDAFAGSGGDDPVAAARALFAEKPLPGAHHQYGNRYCARDFEQRIRDARPNRHSLHWIAAGSRRHVIDQLLAPTPNVIRNLSLDSVRTDTMSYVVGGLGNARFQLLDGAG